MPTNLKIFTLNCWGIPYVAKHLQERFHAIAEALAEGNYDIVCLQEVWAKKDFARIREKVSSILPHSHYFYSGTLGSGICILSKHPIEEVYFHQWSLNGYIHKIQHADWFGGKGIGLCRLRVDEYIVNVYSAHLHAEYNPNDDEYKTHRVLQAFEAAQFIKLTVGNADLVILAGDLNTVPGDLSYRLIQQIPDLLDSFDEHNEDGECTRENLGTNENWKNSYTANCLIKDKVIGKRIDHIMYKPGSNLEVILRDYCLPLPDRVPSCSYSYSDHEAVCATLSISKNSTITTYKDLKLKKDPLEESIQLCNDELKRLDGHKILYWFLAFLFTCLFSITMIFDVPWSISVPYDILRLILGLLLLFYVVMATLWNSIEQNSVIAGKLAMEVTLKTINSETK